MLLTTVLLWVNILFAGLTVAVNAEGDNEQQLSISASSFIAECSKCSFCCTPHSECLYFDKTATYTCQPKTDADTAAYSKLLEEYKQYMITAPPGSEPTIAPRAVVNTRRRPHRNGTSGATMAMGKPEGLGGLLGAAVLVATVVGFLL